MNSSFNFLLASAGAGDSLYSTDAFWSWSVSHTVDFSCVICFQIALQKRLSVHFKSFWAEKSPLSFYVNFNIISRSFIIINQYYGARREIFSCLCLLHRHRRCRRYTIDRFRHSQTSSVSRLHSPLSFSTHSIGKDSKTIFLLRKERRRENRAKPTDAYFLCSARLQHEKLLYSDINIIEKLVKAKTTSKYLWVRKESATM